MLIVQRYHSISEIDQEFISSIEHLLKEDIPHFQMLHFRHDDAPAFDVFTYFLFFGPTQNTPVGFAQVTLRQIPWRQYLPWWKRIFFFWRKDHLHWKQAIWKVADGAPGLYVFDPRYMRSGKEKIETLIKEYAAREDIMATHAFMLKGLQDNSVNDLKPLKDTGEIHTLDSLPRSWKTYQDYLQSLTPEIRKQIMQGWKDLHGSNQVALGDYNSVEEIKDIELPENVSERLRRWNSRVLTFEKEGKALGCISCIIGKEGNLFFEPFPFEAQETALVHDELYLQYALVKFFEVPEARRCHIMKNGEKLFFSNKEDLQFFRDQGFGPKTLTTQFSSQLPKLTSPV